MPENWIGSSHCLTGDARSRLTRHKISDREPTATRHAAKAGMANTHNGSRSLARGSLHRLVRCCVEGAHNKENDSAAEPKKENHEENEHEGGPWILKGCSPTVKPC